MKNTRVLPAALSSFLYPDGNGALERVLRRNLQEICKGPHFFGFTRGPSGRSLPFSYPAAEGYRPPIGLTDRAPHVFGLACRGARAASPPCNRPTPLNELFYMLQMDFEGKFEAERISRLEREGRILKQLADHEQEVATDFETERVWCHTPPPLWWYPRSVSKRMCGERSKGEESEGRTRGLK